MVIYIAGKMRGLPDLGRAKFAKAAERLSARGHIVLNPGVLPIGMKQENYLPICMAMLDAAEAVYALDKWWESSGASLEVVYAKYQGKEVYYELEDDYG